MHYHIPQIVKMALREDLGPKGDVTSLAIIPANSISQAKIIAKENGVLCGLEIAKETFRQLDRKAKMIFRSKDGKPVQRGQTVLEIHGKTRAILAAERTALNFIQRLSGIATLTNHFVKKLATRHSSLVTRILDTRKTTPLLRTLEKYAVKRGDGRNHRFGLYDMVLIKDNHIAALAPYHANPIREAVLRARKQWPRLTVEVECKTLNQVKEAVKAKADIIMLDNMNIAQMRRAIKFINGRAKVEASGNVNLKTITAIAKTGVNFISIGALTHSAPSLDFSLEICPS